MSEPLKAGRELDQLVSDAVFGPWDEQTCRVCGWPIVSDGERGCWRDNCSLRPPPRIRADEPQPYSTEITAAWQVVEKLKADGFGVILNDTGGGVAYRVRFWRDDWSIDDWVRAPDAQTVWADTAPLAICLAALEAVRARPTEQETR